MVILKYNETWGQFYIGLPFPYLNHFNELIEDNGGKLNTRGWKIINHWNIEFDNELDATMFKLKFGL